MQGSMQEYIDASVKGLDGLAAMHRKKRLGTCHGPTWSNTVQADSVLWISMACPSIRLLFLLFLLVPTWLNACNRSWDGSCCNSILGSRQKRSWDIKTTSNSPKPTEFLPWTSAPLRMLCTETANSWPNLRFGTSKVSNPRTSAVSWPRLLPKYRGDLRSRYGHFAESHVLMVNGQRFITSLKNLHAWWMKAKHGKTSSTKPVESE